MRGFLAGVALIFLVSAAAADRTVEGYVARNGMQLELKDGFALRGPRDERVTVYLYPVAIGQQDIQTARAGQPWAVALRKASPDPRRWDWCPTVEIDMQSVNGALDGRGNLTFANFMFSGLDRRNHTVNLTRSGDQVRATITELRFSQRNDREYVTLSTRASGLSYDGKTEHAWRIKATVPVYTETQPDGSRGN